MLNNQLESVEIKKAVKALMERDQRLTAIIKMIGPCQLERGPQGFQALANSIIGQQLSGRSARAIRARVAALYKNGSIQSEGILETSLERLRDAGMSLGKAQCLHSLAQLVVDDEINFLMLETKEDEEVIRILTQVKGIGRWTAEMFLMFSLGRLDIFPINDQSIRSAMIRLYDLNKVNFKSRTSEISDEWRPYRTIASWYLYRYLDLDTANQK